MKVKNVGSKDRPYVDLKDYFILIAVDVNASSESMTSTILGIHSAVA